jgi:hypothetical protein
MIELFLKNYRAVPNNGVNSIEAFRGIAADASGKENVTVFLGGGTYFLGDAGGMAEFDRFMNSALPGMNWADPADYSPYPFGTAMRFDSCRNLTVDGEGAVLIFKGFTQPAAFTKCRGLLTVKNVTIDWERPFYSFGEILEIKKEGDGNVVGSLEVKVFDEFPISGGEPVHVFQEYEPDTLRPMRREYMGLESSELIAPQTLRLNMKRPFDVEPGNAVCLRHPHCCFGNLEFFHNDDINLTDITIHASGGFGFGGRFNGNITAQRVKIIPRPGTRKVMSSNHDGMGFGSGRGAVEYLNCEYEGMGDDCAGASGNGGRHAYVREKLGVNTLIAYFKNYYHVQVSGNSNCPLPGEELLFTDLEKLNLDYWAGTVEEASLDKSNGIMKITFKERIPDILRPNHVFNNISYKYSLHYDGCYFGPNRSRGAITPTSDVLVENCRFDRSGGTATYATTELYWEVSRGRHNITVRNNTYRDCGRAVGNMGGHAVTVDATGFKIYGHEDNYGPAGFNSGILIENNKIEGEGIAINLCSAEDVIVRNNEIKGSNPSIRLHNCRKVKIENNTFPDASNPVLQDGGCDSETIIIS